MAGQAQSITVACHYTVGVAEAAHGVAVAVDHRAELAVFVVAVSVSTASLPTTHLMSVTRVRVRNTSPINPISSLQSL